MTVELTTVAVTLRGATVASAERVTPSDDSIAFYIIIYHILICAVVTVTGSLPSLLPVTSFTATTVMEYVVYALSMVLSPGAGFCPMPILALVLEASTDT